MKSSIITPTLGVALALLLSACGDRRDDDVVVTPAESDMRQESADAWADAKDATQNAWDETRDAARDTFASVDSRMKETVNEIHQANYTERTKLQVDLSDRASDIDNEIAELRGEGRQLSADAQERLAEARQGFNEKLSELAEASPDDWEEAKAEAAEAWQEFQLAYQQSRQELQVAE